MTLKVAPNKAPRTFPNWKKKSHGVPQSQKNSDAPRKIWENLEFFWKLHLFHCCHASKKLQNAILHKGALIYITGVMGQRCILHDIKHPRILRILNFLFSFFAIFICSFCFFYFLNSYFTSNYIASTFLSLFLWI